MITSLDNKTVKYFTKLHQKKYRDGKFLLMDSEVTKAALDSDHLDTLIYSGILPFEFNNTIEVSKEVLYKIGKREDIDYIGVGRYVKESDDYKNRILILDHLQDPLNIGRIMEAALLFNFDSIILSDGCADIYNEKCLVNSRGAIFKLNICFKKINEEIIKLKNCGFKIYATGLHGETKHLNDISASDKLAIILGNEGSGVDANIMNNADDVIKIDMENIDSLNVAMAGSIMMHHFYK